MGCNCRGGSKYTPTLNRQAPAKKTGICQKIVQDKLSLPVVVTGTGELLLDDSGLTAHSLLTSSGCRGIEKDTLLDLEITLTLLLRNPQKKEAFLSKKGKNSTLGSLSALVKSIS